MLALFHDFSDRSVLIVGGGSVALRKARTFADEADVTVVAPVFVDGFAELPCELLDRRVEPADASALVDSAYLVVPATDDGELNEALASAAREAGCLVNRVDEPGDVVVPGRAASERLTVAIATDGASPAVSKYLRRELEPLLERTDPMVRLQAELRQKLQTAADRPQAERRDALWRILEDERVWAHLDAGEYDAARSRALELAALDR